MTSGPIDRCFAVSLQRRQLLLGIAASTVAGAALSLPASTSHAQSNWDAVTAEAKKEGKLFIYNGSNFPVIRKIADEFQKQYGIAVDVLDGRAVETRERVRAEQAAGRKVGDLHYGGEDTLSSMLGEKAFQDHGAIPNIKNIAEPLKDNNLLMPTTVGTLAILVNTDLVKGADEPKSWRDLTDAKWKGKILSDDPKAPGAGGVWFEVMLDKLGREFHDKMAAQALVMSRVQTESYQRIGRGEMPMFIPFNTSAYEQLKGLPIKVVVPDEGTPYVVFVFAMLRDAPHPNAAKLFMNYALDRTAQEAFAATGFRPAVAGMDTKIAADLRTLAQTKLMGKATPGRVDEILKIAAEIYK